MKLTEKSAEVFNSIREAGGKISIDEIANGLNRTSKSVGANVTDLQKKGLACRVKEKVGDTEITYVVLTDEGAAFDPNAPEAE